GPRGGRAECDPAPHAGGHRDGTGHGKPLAAARREPLARPAPTVGEAGRGWADSRGASRVAPPRGPDGGGRGGGVCGPVATGAPGRGRTGLGASARSSGPSLCPVQSLGAGGRRTDEGPPARGQTSGPVVFPWPGPFRVEPV